MKDGGKGNGALNDIEAGDWLAEVGMGQYLDVFVTNFGNNGTSLLDRRRLSQVRMKDLATMGISRYDHEKLIMQHITHTLAFDSVHSPIRKREVMERVESQRQLAGSDSGDAGGEGKIERVPKFGKVVIAPVPRKYADDGSAVKKGSGERRRRSFDKNVWQCINTLRTTDQLSLTAVEALREGNFQAAERLEVKVSERRRRRRTFGEDEGKGNEGTKYGNKAHAFDIMLRELHELQSGHLRSFKEMLKCEHAHILFLHDKTRDLLLVVESGVWFRIQHGSGIAGACVETGECINIPDAYEDPRFNSNLDSATGLRTKQVLVQPIRGQRGGGSIIGVIQMSNTTSGAPFDQMDEENLALCVQRIADDLSSKFRELLSIADSVIGTSIFVGEKGGDASSRTQEHRLDQPTAASIAARMVIPVRAKEAVWRA